MSKNNKQLKYRIAVPKEINKATVGKGIFNDGKEYAVAVYTRIANADAQEAHLLEMQREYFTDLISRQSNWRLVDIYCDFGASGISQNRKQFNRMIEDCEKGTRGINLIIVKNISRFSRNIVDLKEVIEKLARLTPPVGIYFELENLYTLDEKDLSFIDPLCPFTWDRRKYKCETT